MRIALGTLGCKLNQAETERLTRDLLLAGHRLVDATEAADVYILNSCTVTRTADVKCRAWLRQARRRNPAAKVVVTGCYAQRDAEELSKIPGVTVVGNSGKETLLSLPELRERRFEGVPARESAGLRTRSFVKVQDGCSRACSYCIVPSVRGPEKSQAAGFIIDEIKTRVAEGCREIVLTGTEVGAYRAETGLPGLLKRILAETDIPRLRLSSLQPQELSPELLSLWKDERLCPHFHLCLQSGSGTVLRRMKRAYSRDDFAAAVEKIRGAAADVSITSDIIVGFPGETESEFENSLEFCRDMKFARIHVFPYSIRPGTAAASMPVQIDSMQMKERTQRMLALARASSDAFRRQFLGRTMTVLWEASKVGGKWSGHTGNYIKVSTNCEYDIQNRLLPARLQALNGDGMSAAGVGLT